MGIDADVGRATGVHEIAAMRIDPILRNTGQADTTGCSAVFYPSQVKMMKV